MKSYTTTLRLKFVIYFLVWNLVVFLHFHLLNPMAKKYLTVLSQLPLTSHYYELSVDDMYTQYLSLLMLLPHDCLHSPESWTAPDQMTQIMKVPDYSCFQYFQLKYDFVFVNWFNFMQYCTNRVQFFQLYSTNYRLKNFPHFRIIDKNWRKKFRTNSFPEIQREMLSTGSRL